MNIYTRLNTILANIFFGLEGNLIFGIASQLSFYIRQLTMGLISGLDAVSARLHSLENTSAKKDTLLKTTFLQCLTASVFASFITLFSKEIITFLFGNEIQNSALVPKIKLMFDILLIGVVARTVTESWMAMMVGAGQTKRFAPITFVAALLNVPIILILMNFFDTETDIFALSVSFALLMLVTHLIFLPFTLYQQFNIGILEVYKILFDGGLLIYIFVALLVIALFGFGDYYVIKFGVVIIILVFSIARSWRFFKHNISL